MHSYALPKVTLSLPKVGITLMEKFWSHSRKPQEHEMPITLPNTGTNTDGRVPINTY